MALEMRAMCEKRQRGVALDGAAFICSYECTFCDQCAAAMLHQCPTCSGELVARPRRGSALSACEVPARRNSGVA
jgi:uncharacterized protein